MVLSDKTYIFKQYFVMNDKSIAFQGLRRSMCFINPAGEQINVQILGNLGFHISMPIFLYFLKPYYELPVNFKHNIFDVEYIFQTNRVLYLSSGILSTKFCLRVMG